MKHFLVYINYSLLVQFAGHFLTHVKVIVCKSNTAAYKFSIQIYGVDIHIANFIRLYARENSNKFL